MGPGPLWLRHSDLAVRPLSQTLGVRTSPDLCCGGRDRLQWGRRHPAPSRKGSRGPRASGGFWKTVPQTKPGVAPKTPVLPSSGSPGAPAALSASGRGGPSVGRVRGQVHRSRQHHGQGSRSHRPPPPTVWTAGAPPRCRFRISRSFSRHTFLTPTTPLPHRKRRVFNQKLEKRGGRQVRPQVPSGACHPSCRHCEHECIETHTVSSESNVERRRDSQFREIPQIPGNRIPVNHCRWWVTDEDQPP